MPKIYKDLTGKTFGRLTAISNRIDSKMGRVWLCKCECGKFKEIVGGSLTQGHTTSCGLSPCRPFPFGNKNKHFKGYKEIHLVFFNTYKNNSKLNNVEFEISIEYVWDIFIKQKRKCALSGVELKFSSNLRGKRDGDASIDRINPKLGYIKNNIQLIHKDLNIIKGFSEDRLFILLCKLVANKHKE